MGCDHRRGPGAQELKQWASLARLLCEQGWPPTGALSTAWRQTYINREPSPDARASSAAALQQHCASITASDVTTPPDALALSLYRPASWPTALSAGHIASESHLAALESDAELLTHLLAQIAAIEAAASEAGQQGVGSALGAAALPATLLHMHLQGAAAQDSGRAAAALVQAVGERDRLESALQSGVQMLLFAAACFAERSTVHDWRQRLQWLSSLMDQVSLL